MKVSTLRAILKDLPGDAEIYVSSDEELNTLFKVWEFGKFNGDTYVIYGLSGSEV